MPTSNQKEPSLPISKFEKRESTNLLPRFYRTNSNKKFLESTVDQLTQPGAVKKITGYIGREYAKAATATDIFLKASDIDRQNYQLEPAAVIQDYFGAVKFYKDYIDHINHVKVLNGITNNHGLLNQQEYYSWEPGICWDKFVNFQQYYWMPAGPPAIPIEGQKRKIESTYTVKEVWEGDNYAYVFSPNGLSRNPTLTLYRGQTYNFEINAINNPFSFKTRRAPGTGDLYTAGVTDYKVEKGTISFTVPLDAPDVLFYNSSTNLDAGGMVHVKHVTANSFLDVETDILGKTSYTSSNGVTLSNGMKVTFTGTVTPEIYSKGNWYVEGVGKEIVLVSEAEINEYSTSTDATQKDYIVCNRASVDRSLWARNNKWFHKDVIAESFKWSNLPVDIDQQARAVRPIIEFKAGMKLYNYGYKVKPPVNLVDTFTKDVFSNVQGLTGYNIDGVDLADGMRVLFTADPDPFVSGKIYKVNFIPVSIPGRRIEFNPSGIDDTNHQITFSEPHNLRDTDQVVYLTNGFTPIDGVIARHTYYVKSISPTSIQLYIDDKLSRLATVNRTQANLNTETHILEVYVFGNKIIHLEEDVDATPCVNENVLVLQGEFYKEKVFWFNGETWNIAQEKNTLNQHPLFDVVDEDFVSYGDLIKYENSTFAGCKVFSYKQGSDNVDPELKFPLSYLNINNVGDIEFEFNLLVDTFTYKENDDTLIKSVKSGFVEVIDRNYEKSCTNGWKTAPELSSQPIVRTFKNVTSNTFEIDVFDDIDQALLDLRVHVFLNGNRVYQNKFEVKQEQDKVFVTLTDPVESTDIVTLEIFSKSPKNEHGHYKIPINLQNNPLNDIITSLTLGQVTEHVNSLVCNLPKFNGEYPGPSNIRDIILSSPEVGTKIVQHSAPLNFALYHLGSKNANIIKALEFAREQYGEFKRSFIVALNSSGFDADPRRHVDFILEKLAKDKPMHSPFYLSDMFPFANGNVLEIEVVDKRQKIYPLTKEFTLKKLSNKAVNIYLNGEHLLYGKQYEFKDGPFFEIKAEISDGDLIEVYEYETTDGTFCPPTPTKLGIFPKYEPAIYIDTSYLTPTKVIRGHDGSITAAFNDYRDELILELEKRIFNNIKEEYDPSIFNVHDFIPGYSRDAVYSRTELNAILAPMFFTWTAMIDQDYTVRTDFDRLNPYTLNYGENYSPNGRNLPANWRAIYLWMLDTETPHLTPWKCLGYTIEPEWWQSVYGPAPYTKDNLILWDDIKEGIIREPGKPIIYNRQFAKEILDVAIPVDSEGKLIDPLLTNYAQGFIQTAEPSTWEFGDYGPVETAWRKSSYYPFALLQAAILMQPCKVLGTCFDKSRTVRNLSGQLVYKDTGSRIRLSELKIPSTVSSEARVFTSGLVNYIVEYLIGDINSSVDEYVEDLQLLTNKVGSKLGGFTSKDKYKLILDSKNPSAPAGVFVPDENYRVFLNTSSPVSKVAYSGVIITKVLDGFEIRGYNIDNPYFSYYRWHQTARTLTVGGITEAYIEWTSGTLFQVGQVVTYNNKFFRVTEPHVAQLSIDLTKMHPLPEAPIIGGVAVSLRKEWNKFEVLTLPYSSKLPSIQDVADFIQGYSVFLKDQGFEFENFNGKYNYIENWDYALKEFLFWTTQNWAVGSTISLSPAANQLRLKMNNTVVHDVLDPFYGYNVYKVNGERLDPKGLDFYRGDGYFTVTSSGNHGIYGLTCFLVQKEHAVLLDNTTLFNDLIYDHPTGYKQDRLKVTGYITQGWNGKFDIPGFVFDNASITEWKPWVNYKVADTVKYKSFYYAAKENVVGSEEFDSSQWVILREKPSARLLPNWDYRATQFTDFYDLDTDNFDVEQQRLAQHLIGYQKRQYLRNIITDDVSQYKFYQGMITEKGTKDVLDKLFDVVSKDEVDESIEFNEEWAVRIGSFGASSAIKEYEILLDESRFKLQPQPIEIVKQFRRNDPDLLYRVLNSELLTQNEMITDIFPMHDKEVQYLRTPGYLKYDECKISVSELADLPAESIAEVKENDLVWCAFEGWSWNVYSVNNTKLDVTNASYKNDVVTLEIDNENKTKGALMTKSSVPFIVPPGVKKLVVKIFPVCTVKTVFDDDNTIFEVDFTVFDKINLCGIDKTHFEFDTTIFEDNTTIFDGIEVQPGFTLDPSEIANSCCTIDPSEYSVTKLDYNLFEVELSNISLGQRVVKLVLTNLYFNEEDKEADMEVTYFSPAYITNSVIGIKNHPLLEGFHQVTDFTETSVSFKKVIQGWESFVPAEVELYNFDSRKERFVERASQMNLLRPDIGKIKKAFLYNTQTQEIVKYLDVVDPIQGRIPGLADQEVKFKTYYDPATYTMSDGRYAINVDTGMAWGVEEVGTLWWDLTRAKFLENLVADSIYSSSSWNQLFKTASIDVYEWVESKYKPSERDKIADTERGLSLGISGKSRYGDAIYCLKQRYDPVGRTFINTYYYWVKQPVITPRVPGRKIPASDVSRLIADPRSYGYPCVAAIAANRFALVNCEKFLEDNNVAISFQLWDINDTTINTHSQWKLLSEDKSSRIPKKIERKWVDSLVGKDTVGRAVPNLNLPVKFRYGVEDSPRQSMFINRFEALKQFVEEANAVLVHSPVVDLYDLKNLHLKEEPPLEELNKWDKTVETDSELRFIGTAKLRQASVSLIVEEGRIVDAQVTDTGFGYLVVPEIVLHGLGRGAVIELTIDNLGRVDSATVLDQGSGYDTNTTAYIRPFTVYIESDRLAYNKWSLRYWDQYANVWQVAKFQSYDVSRFWRYADWYEKGISQYTKPSHVVDNVFQMTALPVEVGSIVKVTNFGSAGWALFEKVHPKITSVYSDTFKIIARENGTIQLSDSLYIKPSYDKFFYDDSVYDGYPFTELRTIIEVLRDSIFINDLYPVYLRLFFSSVKYVLSEQLSVDWVFKTSFVKARHNVGRVKQIPTYNTDPLESYEDYIKEVKPYRTKIREYISGYTAAVNAANRITDFDLPVTIDAALNTSVVSAKVTEAGEIEVNNPAINEYPWKDWLDHVSFVVKSIEVADGGQGYISPPIVRISGGFGRGASAVAIIEDGKVIRVDVTSSGTGYFAAPIVELDGGLAIDGRQAKASAIIDNDLVRTNKIAIKFDRVSKTFFVTELTNTETFVSNGEQTEFNIRWSPKTSNSLSTVVKINDEEIVRGQYILLPKVHSDNGTTKYTGILQFVSPPALDAVIEITYEKNFEHLEANDRINFFYNPVSGQLGKDLSQLMTGIDYGGVNVTGFDFSTIGGWGSYDWSNEGWDSVGDNSKEYVAAVTDTREFILPFDVPENEYVNVFRQETILDAQGQFIDIWVRLDDPNYGTSDPVTTPNAEMQSLKGDGTTITFSIPTTVNVQSGDVVKFVLASWDGSMPTPYGYDTDISAGKFANGQFSTALGILPEEIVLDGDKFVTPDTSYAPEEVVPGQVLEAVSIKVFTRAYAQSPNILNKQYLGDGATDSFVIGQNFRNDRSVIVVVDNVIQLQAEYTIDWKTNTVNFNSPPAIGAIVNVISFGINSTTLLDLDHFVSDGETTEYITKAPWIPHKINATVLVNGGIVDYSLFVTDESYYQEGLVAIRFKRPSAAGSLIIVIVESTEGTETTRQNSSVVKSQQLVFDETIDTYDLTELTTEKLSAPGLHPYDTNVIVKVDDKILTPSSVVYFYMKDNEIEFAVPAHKVAPGSVAADQVRVYVNGNKLTLNTDYQVDLAGISIAIENHVYSEGAKLAVVFDVGNQYRINENGTITFVNAPLADQELVEVITFFNHSTLNINRTVDSIVPSSVLVPGTVDYHTFSKKVSGHFALTRPTVSEDYLWVIKNNRMLTPKVDFVLSADRMTVSLVSPPDINDVVQIISFAKKTTHGSFGYMIFKDMLNRTHYKRLSKAKSTKLVRQLFPDDLEIYVEDGGKLSDPIDDLRIPGVIEVNGERIEYYEKAYLDSTNTRAVLRRIRRATLGTSMPQSHRIDQLVIDIGYTETIPYKDEQLTITNKELPLDVVPIDGLLSASDYGIVTEDNVKDVYSVFAGGLRLRKSQQLAYGKVNEHGHLVESDYPYSPEGDTLANPEFAIDIQRRTINLLKTSASNVFVVRQIGRVWADPGKTLGESNSLAAIFIKDTETVWPQYIVDKYQYVLDTDQGTTILLEEIDKPLELD
jgi:hypothetical protein